MAALRFDGRITAWNDDKGFGFATPDEGDQDIFVHVSACDPRNGRRLQVGDRVSFEVERNAQGKKRARAVRLPDVPGTVPFATAGGRGASVDPRQRGGPQAGTAGRPPPPSPPRADHRRAGRAPDPEQARRRSGPPRMSNTAPAPGAAARWVFPMFCILLLYAAWAWKMPGWVPALYAGASVLSLLAYAMDKSAARRGAWRVSEKNLHLLALAGGWPGALLAQGWMRHKTVKAEFRAVFWTTVAFNIAAFLLVVSPQGLAWLQGMLNTR